MAFVISVQGCHAVGKSTLINQIKLARPDISCWSEGLRELDARKANTHLRMDVEEEFYQIQRWYVEHVVRRFRSFPPHSIVMLDRGPEEIEFYLFHYLRIHRRNWDIEAHFSQDLARLRRCRSNRVLYLDASLETIIARRESDARNRPTMDVWLRDWQPYVEAYFKSMPKTVVLNTDQMTAQEVFAWTVKWIDEGCPLF